MCLLSAIRNTFGHFATKLATAVFIASVGFAGVYAQAQSVNQIVLDAADSSGGLFKAKDDIQSVNGGIYRVLSLRAAQTAIEAACNGNIAFGQQIENALKILEVADLGGKVPVYPGCAKPLLHAHVDAA